MDVAEGMLTKYRATASELGLSEQRMMAVRGDVMAESPESSNSTCSRDNSTSSTASTTSKPTATSKPLTETEPARPSDEEHLTGFDLVAICMALHHIEDVELATRRLAERLRPGGVLLVVDWADMSGGGSVAVHDGAVEHRHRHDGAPLHAHAAAAHTVAHASFSEARMAGLFEQAGCDRVSFVLADELSDVPAAAARSGKMQLFFARARRRV